MKNKNLLTSLSMMIFQKNGHVMRVEHKQPVPEAVSHHEMPFCALFLQEKKSSSSTGLMLMKIDLNNQVTGTSFTQTLACCTVFITRCTVSSLVTVLCARFQELCTCLEKFGLNLPKHMSGKYFILPAPIQQFGFCSIVLEKIT